MPSQLSLWMPVVCEAIGLGSGACIHVVVMCDRQCLSLTRLVVILLDLNRYAHLTLRCQATVPSLCEHTCLRAENHGWRG